MAIFHFHVDRTCRAKEQSPVAAAAYRSAQKLYGERDGITHNDPVAAAAYRSGENLRNEQQGKEHDYTRKHGVVHSEIMLPKHAPKEFKDRATLWNSADKAEKQWNAQTARQIDIALPVEFTLEEHIKNLREYVQENFVDEGMCADWNIHDNGDGNPHVHIQLTMRPLNEDGTWGNKTKKEYILDKNGERIKLKNGKGWKSNNMPLTDWEKTETLVKWRKNWADMCNKKFAEKGLDIRIDHRTLEAQGIDREPQIHVGVTSKAMERKGIINERVQKNRNIIARNKAKHIHNLKENYIAFDKKINVLKYEINNAEREARNFNDTAEKIDEIMTEMRDKKQRVDNLKADRQKLGIFKRKEKKSIDNQINHLENSYEKTIRYLEREYKISPEQADFKIQELERMAQSKRNLQATLQDKMKSLGESRNILGADIIAEQQELEKTRKTTNVIERASPEYNQTSKNVDKSSIRERLANMKTPNFKPNILSNVELPNIPNIRRSVRQQFNNTESTQVSQNHSYSFDAHQQHLLNQKDYLHTQAIIQNEIQNEQQEAKEQALADLSHKTDYVRPPPSRDRPDRDIRPNRERPSRDTNTSEITRGR